jgi:hypothetical protein
MHIPAACTQNISVLTFSEALSQRLEPCPYDREKWIYIPELYSEYRYILGTRGQNPLVCIGINPSTAIPGALDNTLKSVSRIASGNGFDSFIMFNVYAQRATRPNDMDKTINPQLHHENMKAFEYMLSELSPSGRPHIWAAWGTIIEKRSYLASCVRDMVEIGKRHEALWLKVGKRSLKGHPHHPLYLRKDLPVEPFDVSSYLDSL